MGILPLQFVDRATRETLGLSGEETYAIEGIAERLEPRMTVRVTAVDAQGGTKRFDARVRIDTPVEAEYYRHGGVLPYVPRNLAAV